MKPLAVLGTGMVTGVGLNSPAACAAMRAAIDGFTETRFRSTVGEWMIGCPVPLDPPLRGRARLAHLAAPAIRECFAVADGVTPEAIPLLLCVAEKDRPGRFDGLDERLLPEVQRLLGVGFHPRSCVIPRGRVGGAVAVALARQWLYEDRLPRCLVAGVDSFLVGPTLAAYEARQRLLTDENSNGFIPGEAGAAVLLGPPGAGGPAELRCLAIGFGRERVAVEAEEPLRADGLVEAIRALKDDGGVIVEDADYRYTDCNGEQYGFKQDRLAIMRTMRRLTPRFDHLHPADCIGEVGAAVGPCVLGLALTAARKGYSPGRGVLCHFSNDDGERAALLLRYVEEDGSP
jgi:3-oxoacyl-[acyl-carrier-protein] synthase-1